MENDLPAADPLQPLHLSCNVDRVTYANSLLAPDEMKQLESMLQQNKDVFAWTHSNMLGHPSICSLTPTQRHTFLTNRPPEDLTLPPEQAEDHPGQG